MSRGWQIRCLPPSSTIHDDKLLLKLIQTPLSYCCLNVHELDDWESLESCTAVSWTILFQGLRYHGSPDELYLQHDPKLLGRSYFFKCNILLYRLLFMYMHLSLNTNERCILFFLLDLGKRSKSVIYHVKSCYCLLYYFMICTLHKGNTTEVHRHIYKLVMECDLVHLVKCCT